MSGKCYLCSSSVDKWICNECEITNYGRSPCYGCL